MQKIGVLLFFHVIHNWSNSTCLQYIHLLPLVWPSGKLNYTSMASLIKQENRSGQVNNREKVLSLLANRIRHFILSLCFFRKLLIWLEVLLSSTPLRNQFAYRINSKVLNMKQILAWSGPSLNIQNLSFITSLLNITQNSIFFGL